MIFYVYMSPGVIEEASEGGSYAVDSLIGILQGFLQNCFIAEFEDGRVMSAVNRHISRLPALDTRKKIGKLFELLKKRRHLICCLVTDYLSECDDLSCVIKQADKALLDFILIAKKEMPCHLSLPPEVKTLSNYNQSDFEAYRSALACYGRTLKPDELAQDYLLNNVFKKVLIYASQIEIYDRIFGRDFGDNFKYPFLKMFKWLEKNVTAPTCLDKIIIHCEKPSSSTEDGSRNRIDYMKTEITSIKVGKLSDIKIEVRFYQKHGHEYKERNDSLPHDRFLIADHIALQVGRGMDFLSEGTKKNRDLTISYKSKSEINELMSAYRQYMLEPPEVW